MDVGKAQKPPAVADGSDSDVCIPRDVDILKQARNTLEAACLIRLGARATLVCHLTGLPKPTVSRLYPALTGTPSPPGQVPFTDTWYLKCNRRRLHANVVWRLYRHLEEIGHSGASVLIHVYETYTQIMDAPLLTLTRAFFVPRLVTINTWYEQTCDHCGMTYIGPLGNDGSTCPACTEYFRYRCRSCGDAIEYRPAGRWKAICSRCYEHRKQGKNRHAGRGLNG